MPGSLKALSIALLSLCLLDAGCSKKSAVPPPLPAPTVTIAKPIQERITDFIDFTGRTDAVEPTEIKPHVSGFLVATPFKEGSLVKKGDVLFKIDDSLYKASLDQAKGELEFSEASVKTTKAEYDIGLAVQKKSVDAISEQEIVKRLGSWEEAKGNRDAAKGKLESAQQNYDWCTVTSPIDGQVGRFNYTVGNYVTSGMTTLTTVDSTNPMYVYFDPDENAYLHVKRNLLNNPVDLLAVKGGVLVMIALGDEQDYPHIGSINYVSNAFNPSTGTIQLRGVFENPAGAHNRRLLLPGMFVRVRLPIDKPHDALLVTEKAIATDQANKCLYVVNDQHVVEYRQGIVLGALQDNGLRVIKEGLGPNEWVIINGLQMVRAGMTVKTEEAPMPVRPVKNRPQTKKETMPSEKEKTPAPVEPKAGKEADTKKP